jgi:hypothetical protein
MSTDKQGIGSMSDRARTMNTDPTFFANERQLLSDIVEGTADVIGAGATGLASQVTAGYGGIIESLIQQGDYDKARFLIEEIQREGTYQPEEGTPGARALDKIAEIFGPVEEYLIDKPSGFVAEKVSPAAGAATKGGITSFLEFIPLTRGRARVPRAEPQVSLQRQVDMLPRGYPEAPQFAETRPPEWVTIVDDLPITERSDLPVVTESIVDPTVTERVGTAAPALTSVPEELATREELPSETLQRQKKAEQKIACGDCFGWSFDTFAKAVGNNENVKLHRGKVLDRWGDTSAGKGNFYDHAWIEKDGRFYDWQTSVYSKTKADGWEKEAFEEYFQPKEVTVFGDDPGKDLGFLIRKGALYRPLTDSETKEFKGPRSRLKKATASPPLVSEELLSERLKKATPIRRGRVLGGTPLKVLAATRDYTAQRIKDKIIPDIYTQGVAGNWGFEKLDPKSLEGLEVEGRYPSEAELAQSLDLKPPTEQLLEGFAEELRLLATGERGDVSDALKKYSPLLTRYYTFDFNRKKAVEDQVKRTGEISSYNRAIGDIEKPLNEVLRRLGTTVEDTGRKSLVLAAPLETTLQQEKIKLAGIEDLNKLPLAKTFLEKITGGKAKFKDRNIAALKKVPKVKKLLNEAAKDGKRVADFETLGERDVPQERLKGLLDINELLAAAGAEATQLRATALTPDTKWAGAQPPVLFNPNMKSANLLENPANPASRGQRLAPYFETTAFSVAGIPGTPNPFGHGFERFVDDPVDGSTQGAFIGHQRTANYPSDYFREVGETFNIPAFKDLPPDRLVRVFLESQTDPFEGGGNILDEALNPEKRMKRLESNRVGFDQVKGELKELLPGVALEQKFKVGHGGRNPDAQTRSLLRNFGNRRQEAPDWGPDNFFYQVAHRELDDNIAELAAIYEQIARRDPKTFKDTPGKLWHNQHKPEALAKAFLDKYNLEPGFSTGAVGAFSKTTFPTPTGSLPGKKVAEQWKNSFLATVGSSGSIDTAFDKTQRYHNNYELTVEQARPVLKNRFLVAAGLKMDEEGNFGKALHRNAKGASLEKDVLEGGTNYDDWLAEKAERYPLKDYADSPILRKYADTNAVNLNIKNNQAIEDLIDVFLGQKDPKQIDLPRLNTLIGETLKKQGRLVPENPANEAINTFLKNIAGLKSEMVLEKPKNGYRPLGHDLGSGLPGLFGFFNARPDYYVSTSVDSDLGALHPPGEDLKLFENWLFERSPDDPPDFGTPTGQGNLKKLFDIQPSWIKQEPGKYFESEVSAVADLELKIAEYTQAKKTLESGKKGPKFIYNKAVTQGIADRITLLDEAINDAKNLADPEGGIDKASSRKQFMEKHKEVFLTPSTHEALITELAKSPISKNLTNLIKFNSSIPDAAGKTEKGFEDALRSLPDLKTDLEKNQQGLRMGRGVGYQSHPNRFENLPNPPDWTYPEIYADKNIPGKENILGPDRESSYIPLPDTQGIREGADFHKHSINYFIMEAARDPEVSSIYFPDWKNQVNAHGVKPHVTRKLQIEQYQKKNPNFLPDPLSAEFFKGKPPELKDNEVYGVWDRKKEAWEVDPDKLADLKPEDYQLVVLNRNKQKNGKITLTPKPTAQVVKFKNIYEKMVKTALENFTKQYPEVTVEKIDSEGPLRFESRRKKSRVVFAGGDPQLRQQMKMEGKETAPVSGYIMNFSKLKNRENIQVVEPLKEGGEVSSSESPAYPDFMNRLGSAGEGAKDALASEVLKLTRPKESVKGATKAQVFDRLGAIPDLGYLGYDLIRYLAGNKEAFSEDPEERPLSSDWLAKKAGQEYVDEESAARMLSGFVSLNPSSAIRKTLGMVKKTKSPDQIELDFGQSDAKEGIETLSDTAKNMESKPWSERKPWSRRRGELMRELLATKDPVQHDRLYDAFVYEELLNTEIYDRVDEFFPDQPVAVRNARKERIEELISAARANPEGSFKLRGSSKYFKLKPIEGQIPFKLSKRRPTRYLAHETTLKGYFTDIEDPARKGRWMDLEYDLDIVPYTPLQKRAYGGGINSLNTLARTMNHR